MISRVAESCFWLQRYMERVDSTARMLEVNLMFVLDVQVTAQETWRPLLVVAGEAPRFEEIHGAAAVEDGERVQEYLTWERRNPSSVLNSVYWARENGRTIRETLSQEMWKSLNTFWHWLSGGQGRKVYDRERAEFYSQLKETSQTFRGICHDTMLHEDPFDFMRLGMLIERAGQTARLLDVKHHKFGPTSSTVESAEEYAQWLAILRSCSATEPFLKRGRPANGVEVAEFLLFEKPFPRSVLHCVDRAWNFLRRILPPARPDVRYESRALLEGLLKRLSSASIDTVLAAGIHDELTGIIDTLARIGDAIHEDFFDPAVPGPEWQDAAEATEVSQ